MPHPVPADEQEKPLDKVKEPPRACRSREQMCIRDRLSDKLLAEILELDAEMTVTMHIQTDVYKRQTRGTLGNTGAMFLMLGIMLPAFLLAMYEKDGLPFEKVVRNIIRAKCCLLYTSISRTMVSAALVLTAPDF